jgi:hypothetical protein
MQSRHAIRDPRDNVFSQTVIECINTIHSLENEISDDHLSHGGNTLTISKELNQLSSSLVALIDSSNEMNELSLQEIPEHILNYIDILHIDSQTPGHYEQQLFQDVYTSADKLADRVMYLQVFSCSLSRHIQ